MPGYWSRLECYHLGEHQDYGDGCDIVGEVWLTRTARPQAYDSNEPPRDAGSRDNTESTKSLVAENNSY
jgi:hypothetical protein